MRISGRIGRKATMASIKEWEYGDHDLNTMNTHVDYGAAAALTRLGVTGGCGQVWAGGEFWCARVAFASTGPASAASLVGVDGGGLGVPHISNSVYRCRLSLSREGLLAHAVVCFL